MNILFLYVYPFDPLKGGVERVTDALARELQKRGHAIYYLVFRKDNNHIGEYAAPTSYFPNPDFISQENKNYYANFIREKDIDICILQNPGFYNRIFELFPRDNCRLISVFHTDPARGLRYFYYSFLRKRTQLKDYLLKFMPRLLTAPILKRNLKRESRQIINEALMESESVVFLTKRFSHNLRAIGVDPTHPKIKYIENPTIQVPESDKETKENIIMFVGRMNANKQPDKVIQIWNNIAYNYPDWKLYIIGDGDMLSYCKSIVRYPQQTTFCGTCSPYNLYKRAKILCMTSVFEGWGMVLTEAMSNRVVPIAFNSFASVEDIIDDGINGVLVAPFSVKEYANKLRHLMDDEMNLKVLSSNGFDKVKSFSPNIVVHKWMELMNISTISSDVSTGAQSASKPKSKMFLTFRVTPL